MGLSKKNKKKFKILKTLAAGDNPNLKKIKKFNSIEVMTGALILKPFDTVIPIEKVKFYPKSKNKWKHRSCLTLYALRIWITSARWFFSVSII